jgi:hypothetical protein
MVSFDGLTALFIFILVLAITVTVDDFLRRR